MLYMKITNRCFQKFVYLFLLLIIMSCFEKQEKNNQKIQQSLFTLISSEESGIKFTNTSIETPNRNLGHYDYFYNGSGVAIVDINNDGLADIFFAGNDTPNKLYLNEGDFKFKDISKSAKIESDTWSTGVTIVDINEDGWMDIYVSNSGPTVDNKLLANQLYVNNGDLTFTEMGAVYGIDDSSYSSQATFFDMDKDGDLDLFVMNHSHINYEKDVHKWEEVLLNKPLAIREKSYSTLYRNNGNGTFDDITKESGLYRPGFGLGVVISDFDENGFLDIYVSNDYFIPDFMFFNQGNGTFIEDIQTKVSHSSFFSMGCDAADFNNDGLVDLVVVDMTPSDHFRNKTLMESMDVNKFSYLTNQKGYVPQYMYNTLNLNRSKGNFSEIGHFSGVAQTDWSWSALFVDLDNDSWKDLMVTNGFKRDTKNRDWINELNERYEKEGVTGAVIYDQLQKSNSTPIANYIFKNKGNLKFEDTSKNWGFNEASFSQGAAYGDLDNDGDLDVVINNLESEAFVYRNNTMDQSNNHFIQFVLTDGKNVNRVLHSKIKVYTDNEMQLVEYSFVRGYLSSMQNIAHFGLGNNQKVDKAEILWIDGTKTTIYNPVIDKKHHIDKKTYQNHLVESKNKQYPFMDVTKRIGLSDFNHKENIYNDYKTETLLPHKQSTLGPCIAVGDVNGDGNEDFYVGGAKGQAGQLYLQDKKRGFIASTQKVFSKDKNYEDLGALFFDVDNDGDLDLYIASGGGGDFKEDDLLLQDRLYLNSGQGQFTRSKQSLPDMRSSTATITANDWDKDGDLDLFIGGRTKPGKYPLPPDSFLLENENGIFKDVTEILAPKLKNAGMITSSCWSDINNDGRDDLIVVGEWMPIMIFLNTTEGFEYASEQFGLSDDIGWFYSINKGDFDNDGDEDFIVGNLGLNNKFQATRKKPLHIYSKDFDENGTLDIVLSKFYNGKLVPIRGKECSTVQMPFIGEKFPMFSDFASSNLEDIFGTENLDNALHYYATNFASLYIENKGGNTLEITELLPEAQLAPIMGSVIWDFDGDGNLDVVIGGNIFNTEIETPSYDAGKGLFLKGNGDGTFIPVLKIDESGIFMPQNVKNLNLLFILKEKRPAILVANNNSFLNLFVWTK